jgi:propanol-preferring alcohol dehydrogenase
MTIVALLCAGLTSYKALKESDARPGQWVCILGAGGGLGHLAVQYGKAMGFRILAIDMGQDKLDYCLSMGAESVIDVSAHDVIGQVKHITHGGAHAVLVIAAHTSAYALAIDLCRPKGTIACVSMPKGSVVQLDMVKIVLHCITLRGTLVGTRQDMLEALDFAKRGLVKCHVKTEPLERVNEVLDDILNNRVIGRVVLIM